MKIKKLKKTFIKQHDQTDCGVACLISITRYYEGNTSFEYLRDISGTNIEGTTLLGLWQAGRKIGFDADGCEADILALRDHNLPTILHIELSNGLQHYVVYYGETKGKAIVGDPSKGIELMDFNSLDELWKSKKCLTLEPNNSFKQRTNFTKEKIAWIKQLVNDDLQALVSSSFMGLVIAILGLSTAIFNQALIDKILPNHNFSKLHTGIWLLCTLLIVQVLVQYMRRIILIVQQRNFQNRIISSFFDKLLALPKSFFDTRKSGDLLARLNDTSRIQQFISEFFSLFVIEFLLLLTSLLFLLIYNVDAGLITLAILPIFIVYMYFQNNKIVKSQQQVMVNFSESQSNYIDTFSGIEVIKNHNLQNVFGNRNLNIYKKFQDSILLLGKISLKINFITGVIGAVYLVLIILNASGKVINEKLSLGQLMAIFTVASGIIPLTSHLTGMLIQFREADVALNRMMELMQYEKKDRKGEVIIECFEELSITDISFRYAGRSLLFKHLSINVRQGEITALLGENGCGKSTLSALIQNFYAPEAGDIKINNNSITEIDMDNLRQHLGVVPQNIHIFNNNIYFNITNEEYSKEGLNRFNGFIKQYKLDFFFEQFPNNIMTLVGEKWFVVIWWATAVYYFPKGHISSTSVSYFRRSHFSYGFRN
ncbi:MAG: ABC transporter transmembrane domain-containing protein [Prolixibacteraceae bacterium]|jgi:ABC-type bacteriocin/lantibiotic exporter with double-glycine peptidase domain|nr:ABC transporter transmembrane domain-containing protein [Prolixibacteraceae bacterium]